MDLLAGKPAITMLSALCLAIAMTAPASAKIPFGACRRSNSLACGRLAVPLDPTGATPGTISLAIRRRRAPLGPARTAVIALAGGPGQPAIPFTEDFEELLGPALRTRDLIVFDQRGTGISHPLSCHAFEAEEGSPASAVRRCAEQIGASRRFYTSQDSVADIEAIRVAGGYEKLVLYGTSYGTKVALMYAQEHPSHVEALVLDSVVPADGPEPLSRSTFAAVPRVLRQMCSFHQCRGVTKHPVSDLRSLLRRIGAGKMKASVIGAHGRRHGVSISTDDLMGLLLDGDLNPLLRSEFPADVRSALTGDRAPLARLLARAGGEAESGPAAMDLPLYYATSCEEQAFPWNRASPPAKRLSEARARIHSLPARSISPFSARNVLDLSDARECSQWPFSTPRPPVASGSIPAVPTLILSGANDLRTPTSQARSVASSIPGSHLLVVPNAGHDVLGTEQGSCGIHALRAFFALRKIKRCKAKPPLPFLRTTPIAPRRLSALRPAKGLAGRPGQTLAAVAATLADLSRQLSLQLVAGEMSERRGAAIGTGGLRRGWSSFTGRVLTLHQYAYVPGVTISGQIRAEGASLHIGGRAAAQGTLRAGPSGRLSGRLGGALVSVSARRYDARLARAPHRGSASPLAAVRAALRGAGRGHRHLRRSSMRPLLELDAAIGALRPADGASAEEALAYAIDHLENRRCAAGC